MKLSGDPDAIQALKAMHQKNPGFIKALLDDARSTTDNVTFFRGEDGVRYRMALDTRTGELHVQRKQDSAVPPSARS